MTVRFETVLDPAPGAVAEVVRNLVASNELVARPEHVRRVAVYAHDAEELIGGVVGYTHWGWLFVSHLWVADRQRGHGVGASLLSLIERSAFEGGARDAHLDTYDFQALGFYEANGYEQFGQLDDYPVGHSRHFLRKTLR